MNSMAQDGYRKEKINPIFSLMFIGLVFIYILSYPPFSYAVAIPMHFRVVLEFIILVFLALIAIQKGYVKESIIILFAIPIFLLIYMSDNESGRYTLSALNKVIFLIVLIRLLIRHRTMCEYAKKGWVLLWTCFAIISIFSFLGYMTGIVSFVGMRSYEIYNFLGDSGYYYHHNPILGNILFKTFLFSDVNLPRITGHMAEPVSLAFFFGWNVIISKDIIKNPVLSKYFTALNFVAGCLTISMTYILFMIFILWTSFINKLIKNKNFSFSFKLMLYTIVILFIAYLFYGIGLVKISSYDDRMMRFSYVIPTLMNSNMSSLLFGHGIGSFYGISGGKAISSGLLNILLERGLILLIFISYLFIKYTKHRLILAFYLFYYLIFCQMTWYPIVILSIVIGYISYHQCDMVAPQYIEKRSCT